MPVVRRSRTLDASAQQVWEVVSDPYHMPRWWPDVKRIEAVEDDRFTQVFTTKKGRSVRMDFRLLASEPPGAGAGAPGRRAWEQELAGTPFERVLGEAITEIVLEPAGESTRVTIALRQKLRGFSRSGGFMLRRATRTRVDQALGDWRRSSADRKWSPSGDRDSELARPSEHDRARRFRIGARLERDQQPVVTGGVLGEPPSRPQHAV